MQENLKKKAQLSNKIFPWFSGLSGDLIFFIAIDTLFVTQVKDLNASQISMISFTFTKSNIKNNRKNRK